MTAPKPYEGEACGHGECAAEIERLRGEVVRLLTEIDTHYSEVNKLTVYWKHNFDRQVEVNATLRARVAALEAALRLIAMVDTMRAGHIARDALADGVT